MSQIKVVMTSRLSEHQKACALIPEMTEKEWSDFLKNVEENGIRQPLDVNKNYEVLDGRHRLRAAKKFGIEKLDVRVHEFTELEEMKFVRDTAIERRSLTPVQKLDIILSMEELVNGLLEEGKKARLEGNKRGAEITNKTAQVSTDTQPIQPKHDTLNQIAEMSGASRATIGRVKRLKKESQELYEQVVKGEKSVISAYDELPKKGRGNRYMSKEENIKSIQDGVKQLNQQSPSLPQEDIDTQMFNANISTFVKHSEQIIGFMERTENVEGVIKASVNRLDANHCIKELQRIIKLLKNGGSNNE